MILLNKPIGLTPYQAIQKFKELNPTYQSSKISPAGRLDPMADGLMLLLVDDENKNQAQHLLLPKTYRTTMLLGVQTDTYDLLGLPLNTSDNFNQTKLDQAIKNHQGKITQPYPPYSAVQVEGKPLYYWARTGQLNTIKIPSKDRDVYSIEQVNNSKLSNKELRDTWLPKIDLVHGEFRQKAIKAAWQELLKTPRQYSTVELEIACSSGTYVRGLVDSIAQQASTHAIALSITRTAIGPYSYHEAINLPPTD